MAEKPDPDAGAAPAAPDADLEPQEPREPREPVVRKWLRRGHTWAVLGVAVSVLGTLVAVVAYLFPRTAPEAGPPEERAKYVAAVDASCSQAYQQIAGLGPIPAENPAAYGTYLRHKAEALDELHRRWEREKVPPGDDEEAGRMISKLSSLEANLMEAGRQLLRSDVEAG
ncbi:MAG: hypothetical protein ABW022_24660, partial [Actinoplanes sp.]